MKLKRPLYLSIAAGLIAASFVGGDSVQARPDLAKLENIKSYCLDFNWQPTKRRGRGFAKPGTWANADPAEHVAWYKAMGANVIQTFCVSSNGYAWYKNGFVPEQPGLKHDFLPEVVKLGHKEGMLVMGYFTIGSNPKWGTDHPDQSYGTPSTYHIPYTDEYLDYLSKSISDAVTKTGVDGFMCDWIWMPKRLSTKGKWIDSEKKLYQQLMGEPFPGEDKLSKEKDTAYSRKAIDRCWNTIKKAAKGANPNCVIWLTSNKINHPHVLNSEMYKEVDWLMNEAGSVAAINKVKGMVGEQTKMITCMALWNGQDAAKAVPEALDAGIGLYGFTTPMTKQGLVPLDGIFSQQVSALSGDAKNIAVLARAYHGNSVHSVWKDGTFAEPKELPPFSISLKGRGRGFQDTAKLEVADKSAMLAIKTSYNRGKAQLTRIGKSWPEVITIRFHKKPGTAADPKGVMIANGREGARVELGEKPVWLTGAVAQSADLRGNWAKTFFDDPEKAQPSSDPVKLQKSDAAVDLVVPRFLLKSNPKAIAIEWVQ